MSHRTYYDVVSPQSLTLEHPVGTAFLRYATQISRDEKRARQEALFERLIDRAAKTSFYKRLWGAKGIERGDIKALEDLPKLPMFDKADIVESVKRAPPFGDFSGLDSYSGDERPPVIFHTTSGTTGKPQPLLFGPKTREVQNLLLGRLYQFQGLRADDVAHSVYGHGMINGGHYIREAVTHWTGATFMSAGTGVETRSAAQVQLMADFGATVILGFADYVKRLADVAKSQGLTIGKDIRIRMISGQFGREDKEAVARLWGGAACFDWYGVGDTGVIAGEGPDQDGHYIFEDAHYVEVCDMDSGAQLADGETGDIVVTCLFKDDVYPIVRFNTHDVTRLRGGVSSLGVNLKRMDGFLGRSDNMVKLRGINIFPQAVGPMMAEAPEFAGEYVCKVIRDETGRDDLIVVAEVRNSDAGTAQRLCELLKRKLGIEVRVELANPGETAPITQVDVRQKPVRLIDERKQ